MKLSEPHGDLENPLQQANHLAEAELISTSVFCVYPLGSRFAGDTFQRCHHIETLLP